MQEIAVVGASLAIGILIIVGIGLVMWAMKVE